MTITPTTTRRDLFRDDTARHQPVKPVDLGKIIRTYDLHLNGWSNAAIASQLGITAKTAGGYISRVRGILGISNNGAKLPPATGFGEQLRIARQYHRMSQTTLAEMLECDHTAVSRIESGQRNPSRRMVEAIAGILAPTPQDAARLYALAGFWPKGVDPEVATSLVGGAGSE